MTKTIIDRAVYTSPVCEVETLYEQNVIMTSVLDWTNDNDPLKF